MSGILQLKDDANFDLNWLFLVNLNTTNDAKYDEWRHLLMIVTKWQNMVWMCDWKIKGEIKGATVCLDESVFENP